MRWDRDRRRDRVQFPAMQALAMAIFEQSGLREHVDRKLAGSPNRKIGPGQCLKMFVGALSAAGGRAALYKMGHVYDSMPLSVMFGPRVDAGAINDRSLGRLLDDMFAFGDLGELQHECYCILCDRYGLSSDLFRVDETNYTVTALDVEADEPGAAVPQRCGHAKDGRNDRLAYGLLTITDDNGIACYERPYDGTTSDHAMDRDAIEFLAGVTDPAETVIVGDCKIVTSQLVELMFDKKFGFVSKCPENFGHRAKRTIVESVMAGTMDPSAVREGWELYDTDMDVDDQGLRFVAYRTDGDVRRGVEFHRDQDLREAGAVFGVFAGLNFNCAEDARRRLDEARTSLGPNCYHVEASVVEVEMPCRYPSRGRPPKGAVRPTRTEYRVEVGEMIFDEARARSMAEARDIRVLITNLPRTNHDADNIRHGATADTVLRIYLDQYRVEHSFRLSKSGMGLSTVYLHKPSRANAMAFVTSMCSMLSEVFHAVTRMRGCASTFEDATDRLERLGIEYDPETGSAYPCGSDKNLTLFEMYADAMGIDLDRILG